METLNAQNTDSPEWSPDGARIYFSRGLYGQREIWTAKFDRITRAWGVTGHGIWFLSYESSQKQTVRFFSFRTRNVTPLFELEKQVQWGVLSMALSRDGRYALAVQLDHSVNDLMMIENFQ